MSDQISEVDEAEKRCPKCDGEMVQGFLMDATYGSIRVASWVKGPPKKAFWTGTKVDIGYELPIGTFRCSSCGFLESYAQRKFAAQ